MISVGKNYKSIGIKQNKQIILCTYNKRKTHTTRKKCGSYIERKGLYKT